MRRVHGKFCALRAFTLIELLVVISVISLLMGILLPALRTARASARSAACLANLRQIGVGFENYRLESDGLLPFAYPFIPDGDGGDQNDPALAGSLLEYVGSLAVFECPSDGGLLEPGPEDPREPLFEAYGTSYEYFPGIIMQFVVIAFPDEDPAQFVTREYDRSPHKAVVMMDGDAWHQGNTGKNALFYQDWHARGMNHDDLGG